MTSRVTSPWRRSMISAGAIAVSAALLSGCVQGSATQVDSDTITMWRPITSDAEQAYIQEFFVDAYNATNPVNPINVIYRDWNTAAQLQQTAVASGSGPDIIYTAGPSNALAYLAADQLLPLTEYAEKFGWAEKIQPWAMETGYSGDDLYLIPETYETMMMLYSPEILEQNGLELPQSEEDFAAFLAGAQSAGLTPIATGSASWAPTTEHLLSVVLNNIAGPEAVYAALQGEKQWTDPEFTEAITTMKGWFDDAVMGGGSERYFTSTVEDLYSSLASGSASSYWTGSWAFNEVGSYFPEDGAGTSWDWSLVPGLSERVPTAPVSIGIGRTIAVNASTENPDGVAAYIDWLISNPAAQLEKTAEVGVAPMPLMYEDADFPADLDPRVRALYEAIAEADSIGYLTWTFWPPLTNKYLYEQMDRVIVGELSPEDYLAGLQEVFDQEFADGLVPPMPSPVS